MKDQLPTTTAAVGQPSRPPKQQWPDRLGLDRPPTWRAYYMIIGVLPFPFAPIIYWNNSYGLTFLESLGWAAGAVFCYAAFGGFLAILWRWLHGNA